MSKSKIKQDPKNARLHSEVNKEQINKSLKDLGAGRSVVIDNEDYLIAGNGVYEQAEKLGLKTKVIESDGTELVVIKRTDLNYEDEKRRKLAIADNATSESSDWNFEELTDDEIEEWGIEEHQEEEIQLEAKEDDFVEEVPEIPITVLGDLYEIGEHRLLCGDSTDSDQVAKLMNGEKADMVFTDPPYNVDFKGQELSNTTKDGIEVLHHKGANVKHDKIKNDSMPDNEFIEFMKSILSNILLFNKGAWYFSFCDLKIDLLLNPLKEIGFKWKSIIIWKKNQATLSGKDYKSRYEPIIYGCPNNSFYGERYKQEDIWEFQRTLKNDLHPTMKPIPLIENAINNSSKIGMIIMDLFLGSGSTMVASHQLERKCYGMELDPKYCDVIVKRMLNLDSKLTIKRNGIDCTEDFKTA